MYNLLIFQLDYVANTEHVYYLSHFNSFSCSGKQAVVRLIRSKNRFPVALTSLDIILDLFNIWEIEDGIQERLT